MRQALLGTTDNPSQIASHRAIEVIAKRRVSEIRLKVYSMGHMRLPQMGVQQHQLPYSSDVMCVRTRGALLKAQQSLKSRQTAGRKCICTARQSGAIVETLSPISLSQTQESVQLLKRTRLITAIKTPYREDGKFDLRAYDAHVESQIAHGVEGLIVGGTTGESLAGMCASCV